MKTLIILSLFISISLPLSAQKTLTGTVVDGDNTEDTVINATVKFPGTTIGTVTDLEGKFILTLPTDKSNITVSYIGYKTTTVNVGDKREIKIILKPEASSLDEVVVVGYGSMKRSDLTGAVGSIDEDAIRQSVTTSLEQTLQGRVAGVQVTQNSGAPGGGISVQIRGINSLNGNEPLYIIDGIAVSGSASGEQTALASINPSDI